MAIMHRPALLIADEATSALDVITQSEILALFRELNRSTGMAILYISHDLASVREYATASPSFIRVRSWSVAPRARFSRIPSTNTRSDNGRAAAHPAD